MIKMQLISKMVLMRQHVGNSRGREKFKLSISKYLNIPISSSESILTFDEDITMNRGNYYEDYAFYQFNGNFESYKTIKENGIENLSFSELSLYFLFLKNEILEKYMQLKNLYRNPSPRKKYQRDMIETSYELQKLIQELHSLFLETSKRLTNKPELLPQLSVSNRILLKESRKFGFLKHS